MATISQTQQVLREGFGVVTGFGGARRLSEETRELAARYLSGEFGQQMRVADFGLSEADLEGVDGAGSPPDVHYARVVALIAERAPLRILPGERLAGAATLLEAARHATPASPFPSTSHTTVGFEKALRVGYRGLRAEVEARLARGDLDARGRDFLGAMLTCLDAAAVWHRRHVEALERLAAEAGEDRLRRRYEQVLAALRPVPENPPRSFREAVQALWFLWSFQRLCGNWSGLGRVDKMLGPFLRRDLAAGAIGLDEARELLAHFWIKGCEWTGAPHTIGGSGDAQFYQNVVLGGVDEQGRDVTCEVTSLVLDIVEELHISDFPVAVRVGEATPDSLLRRIAEVQRLGGGIVSIYNEDLVLRALTRFGYSLEEARDFANDGCWEIILPGKTAFGYFPFDALKCLQDALGLAVPGADGPPASVQSPNLPDFEALYAAYRAELERTLDGVHAAIDGAFSGGPPAPLLSLLVDDCIERARGYHDRGARYSVLAPHAGGLPDVVNSLLAIRRLAYEERRLSLPELVHLLRSDWAGHEPLRRRQWLDGRFYGNDDAEADAMLRRVYDDYVAAASRVHERAGVLRPTGISTFGRELDFRAHRLATAFGARRGDILATNFGPTPGSDRRGPTAVVKSFCSVDYEKLPNGAPLELKIHPGSLGVEAGLDVLVALMRTFLRLGGLYLHIDAVDSETLRDAQKHPERYPNLAVRISGWSARFTTLSRDWQEMVIRRTEQRA